MEETLKILVEYLLEKQTALEMENKRLTQQLQKAEDLKDQFYDGYNAQAEKMAKLAKYIKRGVKWKLDGQIEDIFISGAKAEEVCDILRITREA